MLTIKNLCIYNRKDTKTLINGFSFVLNQGDKLGIIGEEGNGKSTILKAIVGDFSHGDYFEISGEIGKKNEIIGYLPQIIDESILELSPKEYLEREIDSEVFDYNKFYELLSDFSIEEDLFLKNVPYKNISGGEKIKTQLLVLMMKEPTLLLLDEPTNDLDALEWIKDFINKLSILIIFVSHDENLLEATANRIIHIEQLKRKSEGKISIHNLAFRDFLEFRKIFIENQEKNSKKEH